MWLLILPRSKGCNKGFRHDSDTADTNSETCENATPEALEQINMLSTSSPLSLKDDMTPPPDATHVIGVNGS